MAPWRRNRGQNWRRWPTARPPSSAITSAAKRRTSARLRRRARARPRPAPRRTATARPRRRGPASPPRRRRRAARAPPPRPSTSPEAMTGTGSSAASANVTAWSAWPRYSCAAVRGWMHTAAAPASTSRGAARRPSLVAVAQPRADLDGDRDAAPRRGVLHGRDDRGHDAGGAVGLREQRRAGARLDHLAHRARHVEVDQVGAGLHAPCPPRRPARRRRRRTAGSRAGARRRGGRSSRACAGCRSARRRPRSSP